MTVVVGMSLISHFFREIECTSGSWPTSGKVGSVAIESRMVEYVGLAVGISLISHPVPEIYVLPV